MAEAARPDAVADVALHDRAALLGDTLVLADLHLGQAAAGLELPLGAGADLVARLEALLERFDPATVVLAGDVLHAFGTVPHTVADALDGLVAAVRARDAEVVVLAGNHDAMLESVWDGPIGTEHRVGDTVVCHGHERPAATAERYVIGHDHPSITVEGTRRPCYLAGETGDGADLLVLPTFSRLPRGVAVNGLDAGDFQSPLVEDLDGLAPIVWDDAAGETLPFPPLGEFRHRL